MDVQQCHVDNVDIINKNICFFFKLTNHIISDSVISWSAIKKIIMNF
jgi:hypothetical protein